MSMILNWTMHVITGTLETVCSFSSLSFLGEPCGPSELSSWRFWSEVHFGCGTESVSISLLNRSVWLCLSVLVCHCACLGFYWALLSQSKDRFTLISDSSLGVDVLSLLVQFQHIPKLERQKNKNKTGDMDTSCESKGCLIFQENTVVWACLLK